MFLCRIYSPCHRVLPRFLHYPWWTFYKQVKRDKRRAVCNFCSNEIVCFCTVCQIYSPQTAVISSLLWWALQSSHVLFDYTDNSVGLLSCKLQWTRCKNIGDKALIAVIDVLTRKTKEWPSTLVNILQQWRFWCGFDSVLYVFMILSAEKDFVCGGLCLRDFVRFPPKSAVCELVIGEEWPMWMIF